MVQITNLAKNFTDENIGFIQLIFCHTSSGSEYLTEKNLMKFCFCRDNHDHGFNCICETLTLWTCIGACEEKEHQMDRWKENFLQVQRFFEKLRVMLFVQCRAHFQAYELSTECSSEL